MTLRPSRKALTALCCLFGILLWVAPGHAQDIGEDVVDEGMFDVGAPDVAEPDPGQPGGMGDGDAPAAEQLSPEEIEEIQIIRRKELELEAEQFYKEGREAFIKGDYESATSKLISAETKLKDASPSKQRLVNRREVITKFLALAYEQWAEQLAREARSLANADKYEDAIAKYQKVMELNPRRKKDMAKLIGELQRAKKRAEFKESVSAPKVDPDKATRDYQIDQLMAKGQVFFNHHRFSDAREQFEQVLLKDPYHLGATRFLGRIYKRLGETAVERRELMRYERLAEVAWRWADPVAPLVGPGPKSKGVTTPVRRESDGDGIREKLQNIIIPKIQFEDATIQSVVKYLKGRSKDLDPDGVGVNIFLMLEKSAGADAAPEPAPVDDPFPMGGGVDDPFAVQPAPADDPFAAPGADAPAAADDPFAVGGGGGLADDPFAESVDPFVEQPSVGGGGSAMAPAASEITVTLDFDNIPLEQVIHYICTGSGLKYRVEEHAVIIADPDRALDPTETRIYPVEPGFLTTSGTGDIRSRIEEDQGGAGAAGSAVDPLSFFQNYGVDFPEGAKIAYNSRTSRLIVTNTPTNLRKVEQILRELNIQPTQVTIESKFIEISENDLDELGFEWNFLGAGDSFDDAPTDKMVDLVGDAQFKIFKQTGNSLEGISKGLRFAPGLKAGEDVDRLLRVGSIIGDLQFQTVIRALAQKAGTDVLSSPKVTTMSGNTAVIKMVEERHFPESWSEPELQGATNSSSGQTGASYNPSTPEFGESREIGVILEVTPIVGADGYSIELELNPEVLEHVGWDDYSYKVRIGDEDVDAILKMPIIAKRALSTKVIVWDGETVVLGGMITERIEEYDDKVPMLGDLPLVGRLFQAKSEQTEKRNLLIFVSARLVNPAGLPIRPAEIRGLPDFRR